MVTFLTEGTPAVWPFGRPARLSEVTYGPESDPQVRLLRIEHGGHVEPSLRFHYGELCARLVGQQNRDLESAEEAWAFFRAQTVPGESR